MMYESIAELVSNFEDRFFFLIWLWIPFPTGSAYVKSQRPPSAEHFLQPSRDYVMAFLRKKQAPPSYLHSDST